MKELIIKNKTFIKYCIFGLITTILHILLFIILDSFLKYYIANIITLIIVKIIAYIFNKKYVFETKCKNKLELSKEIIKYTISRLLTMIVDYLGLIILVEVFNINEIIGKIIVVTTVVVLNYILSKYYVYKK